MTAKQLLSLGSSKVAENADHLVNAEWDERTLTTHYPEAEPLDTEPVTGGLDGGDLHAQVACDMTGIDTGRVVLPRVHNAFFIQGKVPSLNELLDAKTSGAPVVRSIIMRVRPQKGKRAAKRFSLYNDIKQDWTTRTVRSLPAGFKKVEACYFGYVVVEETIKRDPSNICSAAIKFIEDGLVKAKAITNDGWKQVLGIRTQPIHRPGREPGIFVVMSDGPMEEANLVVLYEAWFKAKLVMEVTK